MCCFAGKPGGVFLCARGVGPPRYAAPRGWAGRHGCVVLSIDKTTHPPVFTDRKLSAEIVLFYLFDNLGRCKIRGRAFIERSREMSRLDRDDLPEAYVVATAVSELAGHVEDDPFIDALVLRLARNEISGDEARAMLREYVLKDRMS